jgi:predicted N-acyltransferase
MLWDLGLVFESPAGSTILIPSAAANHSNDWVNANEHRYSFTQYTAGGIFRYVDNGYQMAKAYMAGLDNEERKSLNKRRLKQLEEGLALYCDMGELKHRLHSQGLDNSTVATPGRVW